MISQENLKYSGKEFTQSELKQAMILLEEQDALIQTMAEENQNLKEELSALQNEYLSYQLKSMNLLQDCRMLAEQLQGQVNSFLESSKGNSWKETYRLKNQLKKAEDANFCLLVDYRYVMVRLHEVERILDIITCE